VSATRSAWFIRRPVGTSLLTFAVTLAGGIVKTARLGYPDYRPDWAAVRAMINEAPRRCGHTGE
jgi:multidrug efflux pump subunit AcrB